MKCALSDKVKSGDFIVLENLAFDTPKTKQMVKLLSDFQAPAKNLFITADLLDKETGEVIHNMGTNEVLAARNIPGVKVIRTLCLNCYDILYADKLFVTKDAIARIEEVFA